MCIERPILVCSIMILVSPAKRDWPTLLHCGQITNTTFLKREWAVVYEAGRGNWCFANHNDLQLLLILISRTTHFAKLSQFPASA